MRSPSCLRTLSTPSLRSANIPSDQVVRAITRRCAPFWLLLLTFCWLGCTHPRNNDLKVRTGALLSMCCAALVLWRSPCFAKLEHLNRSPWKTPSPCCSPLLSPYGLGSSRTATQCSSARVTRMSLMGQKPDKTAHLTSRKMGGSIDFRTLEPTEFFYFRYKVGQSLQIPWRMVFEPTKFVFRKKPKPSNAVNCFVGNKPGANLRSFVSYPIRSPLMCIPYTRVLQSIRWSSCYLELKPKQWIIDIVVLVEQQIVLSLKA